MLWQAFKKTAENKRRYFMYLGFCTIAFKRFANVGEVLNLADVIRRRCILLPSGVLFQFRIG